MADFFDIVFGPGSRVVRRNAQVKLKTDGQGNVQVEPISGSVVTMSADGSIDRVKVIQQRFYDCGCTADGPAGGRCAEPGCGWVSCQKCFSRCARCLQPCCARHIEKLPTPDGAVPLCLSCYGTVRRRALWHGVVRTVLSPFVEFTKSPDR